MLESFKKTNDSYKFAIQIEDNSGVPAMNFSTENPSKFIIDLIDELQLEVYRMIPELTSLVSITQKLSKGIKYFAFEITEATDYRKDGNKITIYKTVKFALESSKIETINKKFQLLSEVVEEFAKNSLTDNQLKLFKEELDERLELGKELDSVRAELAQKIVNEYELNEVAKLENEINKMIDKRYEQR